MEQLTPAELVQRLGRENSNYVLGWLELSYNNKKEELVAAADSTATLEEVAKCRQLRKMIFDLKSAMDAKK